MIKVFSKFLNKEILEKEIGTVDDIMKLPIKSYNFLNPKEAKILTELLDITDIGKAAQLDKEIPLKDLVNKAKETAVEEPSEDIELRFEIYKKNYPDLEKNLKKTITISSLISEIDDQSVPKDLNTQKVIVVGLDNAGKTAVISKVGKKKGIQDLVKLSPTKGVNRTHLDNPNMDLIVWDFGGQEKYREQYLKDPEKYFLGINLLIYVIDVQDPDRFDESFEYFEKILNLLTILEENPSILILIHKFDPDIRNDPKILLNLELVKEQINLLFKKLNLIFDYETYATSIYSTFTKEPEFLTQIKEVINAEFSLTNPTVRKVEGLAKTLEETMNVVIRLSESISEQLNEVDARLNAIESGAFHIAQSGVPIEIRSADTIRQKSEENVRETVLDELKSLFAKKKSLGS